MYRRGCRRGILVVKKGKEFSISNPGTIRVTKEEFYAGGNSDPRNLNILKMFGFVNVGERAGSGIPNIFRVWREQGWKEPVIVELSEPDRIILSLSLLKKESSDKKVAIKNGDKGTKTASQKIAILEYLTDHASAKCSDISDMLGVKDARARRILSEMIVEGTIVTEGGNRNRIYKLKS